MTVQNLIEELKKMPFDAQVHHLWDGEPRTTIEVVYLSRSGGVITAAYDEVCYTTANRPIDAPTREQNPYWQTSSDPKDE